LLRAVVVVDTYTLGNDLFYPSLVPFITITMSAVTVELLEALLSPAAEQRRPAEEYLKAMTSADRCGAFLQALSTIQQPHLKQMIAVLLRRDILQIQQIAILPEMVDPLLAAFAFGSNVGAGTGSTTSADSSRRTSVGDCLAEVCAVLSVLAPSECSPVLQKILQAIGTSVRYVYMHIFVL
jgi:hypothetical protein